MISFVSLVSLVCSRSSFQEASYAGITHCYARVAAVLSATSLGLRVWSLYKDSKEDSKSKASEQNLVSFFNIVIAIGLVLITILYNRLRTEEILNFLAPRERDFSIVSSNYFSHYANLFTLVYHLLLQLDEFETHGKKSLNFSNILNVMFNILHLWQIWSHPMICFQRTYRDPFQAVSGKEELHSLVSSLSVTLVTHYPKKEALESTIQALFRYSQELISDSIWTLSVRFWDFRLYSVGLPKPPLSLYNFVIRVISKGLPEIDLLPPTIWS